MTTTIAYPHILKENGSAACLERHPRTRVALIVMDYLARGLEVVATDPAPNAETGLRKYVDNAWTLLTKFGLAPGASMPNAASPVATISRTERPSSASCFACES